MGLWESTQGYEMKDRLPTNLPDPLVRQDRTFDAPSKDMLVLFTILCAGALNVFLYLVHGSLIPVAAHVVVAVAIVPPLYAHLRV